jgi:hypothetical protein
MFLVPEQYPGRAVGMVDKLRPKEIEILTLKATNKWL